MRNSHRDGRKNGKFEQRYLGLYRIAQHLGKEVYKLESVKTSKIVIITIALHLLAMVVVPVQ